MIHQRIAVAPQVIAEAVEHSIRGTRHERRTRWSFTAHLQTLAYAGQDGVRIARGAAPVGPRLSPEATDSSYNIV